MKETEPSSSSSFSSSSSYSFFSFSHSTPNPKILITNPNQRRSTMKQVLGKKCWRRLRGWMPLKAKEEMTTTSRWKVLGGAFRWKRFNIKLWFVDDLLFKIASVIEAVVLVATLGFFYLFCGCSF